MGGDYHIGVIMDALKELGVDENTLLLSPGQPSGRHASLEFGNQGTPGNGNSGPFCGELGEVTGGSLRFSGTSSACRSASSSTASTRMRWRFGTPI